jgi:NADH-quinone oxidoreductase subunit N
VGGVSGGIGLEKMFTSIQWYSPEIYLIIVSVTFVAFVAMRPVGFGQTTLFWYSQNFTLYVLLITGLLIIQVSNIEYIEGVLWGRTSMTALVGSIITIGGGIYTYYLRRTESVLYQELGVLIMWAILGMLILIGSRDLLMLYMGMELQSLTMYILASIKRNGEYSTEAGLKYFILGAVSSGIYLMGCAIIYIQTGHTDYGVISLMELENITGPLLILIALLWKIGAAPLHMWVPDVYEGAPSFITAFFAIIPKIILVLTILTLLTGPFLLIFESLQPLLIITALLSTVVGAIGGLNQTKFKRILAYSAISHTGFILAGLATGTLQGFIATFIYLIIYIIMSFISFTFVVNVLPSTSNHINIITGLARINPILAITLALLLLSLAGVPPLAGFLSKYIVLLSLLSSKLYFLTFIAIISSFVSAFYYLRLIKFMFFKESELFSWKVLADFSSNYLLNLNKTGAIIIGSCFYLLITTVLYPQPLISLVSDALLSSLL